MGVTLQVVSRARAGPDFQVIFNKKPANGKAVGGL
jgi:hypothetical protein